MERYGGENERGPVRAHVQDAATGLMTRQSVTGTRQPALPVASGVFLGRSVLKTSRDKQ